MDAPTHGRGPTIGIDVGATLAKLAIAGQDGAPLFELLPASAIETLAGRVRELSPGRIGLTGCGADTLEPLLDPTPVRLPEFEAWAQGSRRLLRADGVDVEDPYLLVSIGTGTSVLRVAGSDVTRVGGTALGGGAILGLGAALTGCERYEELCDLAARGQRGNVDLLVGDIYQEGRIDLHPQIIAASFGNLARWLTPDGQAHATGRKPTERQDLASALMGMVGENIARISCGLATSAQVEQLVYGGSTLQGNASLQNMLVGVSAALGWKPIVLEQGSFAGAVGALGHAESRT